MAVAGAAKAQLMPARAQPVAASACAAWLTEQALAELPSMAGAYALCSCSSAHSHAACD
jgi:hypothetical protein